VGGTESLSTRQATLTSVHRRTAGEHLWNNIDRREPLSLEMNLYRWSCVHTKTAWTDLGKNKPSRWEIGKDRPSYGTSDVFVYCVFFYW